MEHKVLGQVFDRVTGIFEEPWLGAPDMHFDWEKGRAVEGFYRFKGGTKCCAERAKAFAPFCDACWMETGTPGIQQSRTFAGDVLATCPNLMLAYNNSPSFNWDSAGLTDDEMETYIWDLAKMIAMAMARTASRACATKMVASSSTTCSRVIRQISYRAGDCQHPICQLTPLILASCRKSSNPAKMARASSTLPIKGNCSTQGNYDHFGLMAKVSRQQL